MNRLVYLLYRLNTAPNVFEQYQEMAELSLRSFRRHLAGSWQAELLQGDYSSEGFLQGVNLMYRDTFVQLEAWHAQGDNTLLLDQDTLCLRPTEIFGRFKHLMLFYLTDPPVDEVGGFAPYLNAGIVYVPASMPPRAWRPMHRDLGAMRAWDDSQRIWNEMFYGQDPVPELHPELHWSPNVPTPLPRGDAHIIHLNSTRGSAAALGQMRDYDRGV